MLKDGLVACSVRGEHSTGVALVDEKGQDVLVAKTIGTPYDLFDIRRFTTASWSGRKAVIGHCRHATMGPVSTHTAHPFEHDNIVGVHNGTLRYGWDHALDDGREFLVDSEALIYNIALNGVEETISRVAGAWALVWWDKNEETLNFLRNKERPLWFANSDDGKLLFWASEFWMIYAMARKNRVKLFEDKQGMSFYSLPEDTLRSIKINKKAGNSKTFVMRQDKEGVEGSKYTAPPASNFRGTRMGFTNGHKRGGEVASPFKPQKEKEVTEAEYKDVNDDLPLMLRQSALLNKTEEQKQTLPATTGTAAGGGSTNTSGDKSKTSQRLKATTSSTPPSTSRSQRPLLSVVQGSRKEPSDNSNPSLDEQISPTVRTIKGGLTYLTPHKGDEVAWADLDHFCSFCTQTVLPKEVAIINKNKSIICKQCVNPSNVSETIFLPAKQTSKKG